MSLRFLRLASLYLVVTSLKLHALEERAQPTPFAEVCNEISSVISSASEVFFPGEPLYEKGIYHLATSSTQQSACVVEAGSPEDVGIILCVLGSSKTPFAFKGGGAMMNPGFSSTPGVHISMYRFSEIEYNATTKTVDVGAGLIWDDVYAALEPLGVNVVGARVTGIGVAGFTLGGGYAWNSNQYGLAIDNVIAFQLVKPDGEVLVVTHASDPDLFFGLKGGYNNFGIVTKFTLKTYPQTQIWGGTITRSESNVHDLAAAVASFQANASDPKAGFLGAYVSVAQPQQILINQFLFYDAPTPPPGLFDALLAIPSVSSDVGTRSFLSFVQSIPINATQGGERELYQGYSMLEFTPAVSDIILNETLFWGAALANKTEKFCAYDFAIYLPSVYSHNPDRTAFPPVRNIPFQSFNIVCSWNSSAFDADFHHAAVTSTAHIYKSAIALGQTQLKESPVYPSYAIAGTPLEHMYGRNLPALRALKARIDPHNVMGLAGGWKF